jgi:hypothetical protein
MNTYLLYEKQSGRIVHRHRQDPGIRVKVTIERLRDLAGVATPPGRLGMVEVAEDAMTPQGNYRVNPTTERLESARRRRAVKASTAKRRTIKKKAATKRTTRKKATAKKAATKKTMRKKTRPKKATSRRS